MAQYKTGTVDVFNDSDTVTGHDTAWLANVQVGNSFNVRGEAANYTVTSVPGNGTLTISPNYAGTDKSGVYHNITRDFTPNLSLLEPSAGDFDSPFLMTVYLSRRLDALLDITTWPSVYIGLTQPTDPRAKLWLIPGGVAPTTTTAAPTTTTPAPTTTTTPAGTTTTPAGTTTTTPAPTTTTPAPTTTTTPAGTTTTTPAGTTTTPAPPLFTDYFSSDLSAWLPPVFAGGARTATSDTIVAGQARLQMTPSTQTATTMHSATVDSFTWVPGRSFQMDMADLVLDGATFGHGMFRIIGANGRTLEVTLGGTWFGEEPDDYFDYYWILTSFATAAITSIDLDTGPVPIIGIPANKTLKIVVVDDTHIDIYVAGVRVAQNVAFPGALGATVQLARYIYTINSQIVQHTINVDNVIIY